MIPVQVAIIYEGFPNVFAVPKGEICYEILHNNVSNTKITALRVLR